ncbi:MAG: DUF2867 domain-containing protein [Arenicella sp.]
MKIIERDIPADSQVSTFLERIDFHDSYEVHLNNADIDIRQLYQSVFTVAPWWVKKLFILRNKIVSVFGLKGATAAEMDHTEFTLDSAIGDKIGVFKLYSIADNEVITGEDDKHLDFRISVLKIARDEGCSVVVTTVVKFNNSFGRAYLFFIKPFHKIIVKHLVKAAASRINVQAIA